MVTRRDYNNDAGNATGLFNPFGAFTPTIRFSGGLPPNPIPALQRLVNSPVPTKVLENNASRIRNVFVKVPVKSIPPVNVGPKFRMVPDPTPTNGRPSGNLAGIFRNAQDAINLHGAVLPSNPIPFRIMEQVRNTTRDTGSAIVRQQITKRMQRVKALDHTRPSNENIASRNTGNG